MIAVKFRKPSDPPVDMRVRPEGTVVVFVPCSVAGQQWLEDNVHSEPWQWLGDGLVVERRPGMTLVEAMVMEGLQVEVGN